MSDPNPASAGTEVDTQVSDPQGQGEQPQPQGGGNPAWDTLRQELDPISFSKIEPHLKSWDAGVNQRFDKLNGEFGWARELVKAGRDPQFINTAVQLAEQLNTDPLAAYQRIEAYLRENNMLPSQTEAPAVEAADPNAPAEEQEDPRLQQLAEQQEAIQQFLIQQENQRIAHEADLAVENEVQQLKEAHPEYSKEDVGEVIQRALILSQQTGKPVSLAEADASFTELRQRLLSTPRPGDAAPRLIPTGGGTSTPSSQPQKTLGQLSNEETQNLIAGLMEQNRS